MLEFVKYSIDSTIYRRTYCDSIEVDTTGMLIGKTESVGFTIIQSETSTSIINRGAINSNLFEVSPNPSSGIIKVNLFENHNNDLTIEVINAIGEVVYTKKINQLENEINLSHYTKGIYFVKISSKEEQSIKKIILK